MDAGRKIRKSDGSAAPLSFDRKRFLIVDDFSDMRGMLRSMLESYGVQQIDQAANGKDAIQLMQRHDRNPYDFILCDYNLGEGQDGQQVLEEAKYKGLIRLSTIFIMITAENTMRMVMGAVEYQPDDYLSKPFNKFQLKSRLDRLMQRKSNLQAIDRAVENDQPAKAVELCNERLADRPKNSAELLKLKAGLLVDLGRYDEAETIYQDVLSSRNALWAKIALGKIRYHTGDYHAARGLFQEVVTENSYHTEAHDWLAKSLIELNETAEAESVLLSAVETSPKAIQRQVALGNLAFKRGNYEVAARAFRQAVSLGKNSVYRSASNYVKQARALSQGSAKDALRVLRTLRKDFRGDTEAILQAAAMESTVYQAMGMVQDASQAYHQATALHAQLEGTISSEAAKEVARAAFVNGDKEWAVTLVKKIVKNNHDDPDLLQEMQQLCIEAGFEADADRIIEDAREAVVHLNNEGVRLAEQGDLERAASLFEKALNDMPENRTINMNNLKVLLLQISATGGDKGQFARARDYLDHLRKLDPDYPGLPQLAALYEQAIPTKG